MLNWLFNEVPWQIQLVILILGVGLPLIMLSGFIFGWKLTLRYVAGPALAVIALLGFASKLRQQGYNDRRAEEEKALDHAEDIAQEERDEAHRLPDVELDEKVDKWSRR